MKQIATLQRTTVTQNGQEIVAYQWQMHGKGYAGPFDSRNEAEQWFRDHHAITDSQWTSSHGHIFANRYEAAKWINEVQKDSDDVDMFFARLYCGNDRRYEKSIFGIYDRYLQYHFDGLPEDPGHIGTYNLEKQKS